MPVEDEGVKAFFAKYTTETAASEHFPLMELAGYNCEEKLATGEIFYQPECGFSDDDAVQLGKAIEIIKPDKLRQIYLNKNQLTCTGACGVAAGLSNLKQFDRITLSDNAIGGAGMAALAEATKGLGLIRIVMSRNKIGDAGAIAFAKLLADPDNFKGLKWLYLNDCEIGDAGAAAIGEALKTGCKDLVRMGLHDNKIGDDGMASLADAINKGGMAQEGEFFYVQVSGRGREGGAGARARARAGARRLARAARRAPPPPPPRRPRAARPPARR